MLFILAIMTNREQYTGLSTYTTNKQSPKPAVWTTSLTT